MTIDELAGGASPEAPPVHLVARPGPARDRVLRAIGDARVVETAPEALRAGETPAGALVLLVADALDAPELLDLLASAAAAEGRWTPVLVNVGSGDPEARVLSVAPVTLHDLPDLAAGAEGRLLPEIRTVLRRGSRVRHDLNNPLTSALAEVQLLLLDAPEGELRIALEAVQTQLLRLRDLIRTVPSTRDLDRPY